MRRPEGLVRALLLGLLVASPAAGDESAGGEIPVPSAAATFRDPQLQKMWALDAIAPFEDKAPLWDYRDPELQRQFDAMLHRLGLDDDVRDKDLSAVIVDVTDPDRPRMAEVNGDEMMYAASLPKIAVLLAAFEMIATGQMKYDRKTEQLMKAMIRRSSNPATTEMMKRVGKENIARVLLSPRYRLYDPARNGGLWVGKDYSKSGLWKRDPLHNLSHGATAMQVARFYYLLETGNLVTPEHSEEMREIMEGSELKHKFVAGLLYVAPGARLLRKSGSWRTFHSDSALVRRGQRTYIVVALSDDREGGQWMVDIAAAVDGMFRDVDARPQKASRESRWGGQRRRR